jgi:hypothetical protein
MNQWSISKENAMKSHTDLEQRRTGSNSTSAIVATLYVLGLASLLFLHNGTTVVSSATAPAIATSAPAYLHAPTSDPSLPSLEATLARLENAPADEAPAPTF